MRTALKQGLMLLITITVVGSAANAMAQSTYGQPYQAPISTSDFGVTYGYGGFGYGPATAAESIYRGQADLVRAYGESNYYHSMAQVYWEQAREKNIANRTAKVEQFFALRKFNQEQRLAAIAKSRLSKEQLVSISKKAAPQRLGEGHWNPATDGLAWPAVLHRGTFTAARARLDELYRLRRDASSGLTGDELIEVQQLVDQMINGLKSMVSEVKPSDYAAAKRFLTSAAHEASFEPGFGERLAQR